MPGTVPDSKDKEVQPANSSQPGQETDMASFMSYDNCDNGPYEYVQRGRGTPVCLREGGKTATQGVH